MYPVLFSIGFLTLYSFGAMIALGYLVAAILAWRDGKRTGKSPVLLLDLGVGAMLGALLGGRILYIALNWREYLQDPLEAIKLQHGGLVFYGGFAGALLFVLFFVRKRNLSFWETVDAAIPYAVLVHAFGRIGCFLNGCCYGKPTSWVWGVTFPGKRVPLHPTQLYESFFLFCLFFLLRGFSQRKGRKPGDLFCIYLFGYGVFRFLVEFFRGDQEAFLWGTTLPQGMSVLLVGASLFFWKWKKA